MKLGDIKTPITVLNGVGDSKAKLFARLNIFTVSDLLSFYPRGYDDCTRIVHLDEFDKVPKIRTVAKVISHQWFGYGNAKTLKLAIYDGTKEAYLVAFNRPFLSQLLPPGCIALVSGVFSIRRGEVQSASFEAVKLANEGCISDFENKTLPDTGILPIYSVTAGLSQKIIRKAVLQALGKYAKSIDDELPESVIDKRNLLHKKHSIFFIHHPEAFDDIKKARHTLIYEELFYFQRVLARRALKHKGFLPEETISDSTQCCMAQGGKDKTDIDQFMSSLSPRQRQLLQRLPFSLTSDQMSVIAQMNCDIDRGYRDRNKLETGADGIAAIFTMARLLQGDVGSGKTLVSFFACLRIADYAGQCAIMAPTELLARQHAENAAVYLEPLGVKIAFLVGNLRVAMRKQILKTLKEGEINIIIGTHALFSSDVLYHDLQLVIIDEQHRFGVSQRSTIVNKGVKVSHIKDKRNMYIPPHLIMMSATPIPRTLALTAFGDLDISTIKTMPSGRKRVATYLVKEGNEQNVYEAVKKELSIGHQAYFVCPAIETDERSEGEKTKSAEDTFALLSEKVYPEYKCALIHSRVDSEEQCKALTDFRAGKIKIIVATTVVEVGVDVPNATCMVIEHANCFGLAQLHQLRGRVGRGSAQAKCFLIYSEKITETGIARLKALKESNDGFVIAEQDLKLRGPGELNGTIQAGDITLGIADLTRDNDILMQARHDAFEIMRRKFQDGFSALDAASV